jgi:hypothetical protein
MAILHFWEHHQNALRSELLEFTERHGSKWWILEYLRTYSDLKDHILPWFFIDSESLLSWSIPDLPPEYQERENSLIYRSSHPDDHRWFIGALPTLRSRTPLSRKTINDLDYKTKETLQGI